MKSSIYISSEKIEVIGYKKYGNSISVKGYMCRPLPEGVLISGKITDPSPLIDNLSEMREENRELFKEPSLIVDGNSILTKIIVVPKLSKKQYARLVRDDFKDSADYLDELVCDYHLFDEQAGKERSLLACAIEKAQIESYVSTFGSAGIKLKEIKIGVQSVLNYVSSKPELKEKPFTLNLIDGVTMLSMIFNNGLNVFISRTRLYGESYEQLMQSILQNLSGLIQFNKSEKLNDMSFSTYLGLKEEDLSFLREINPHTDIRLEKLDILRGAEGAEELPPETHFAFLNILLGADSIDLIRSYKKQRKIKTKKPSEYRWMILAIVGVLAAFAIPIALQTQKIVNLRKDILEVSDYLESPDIVAKSEELDRLAEETAYYRNIVNNLAGKKSGDKSRAFISNEVLDLITMTNSATVHISQLDFSEDTGAIRANGKCYSENDAAIYIDMIKRSDLIEDISYVGYNYNAEGEYTFSVTITLAVEEAEQ